MKKPIEQIEDILTHTCNIINNNDKIRVHDGKKYVSDHLMHHYYLWRGEIAHFNNENKETCFVSNPRVDIITNEPMYYVPSSTFEFVFEFNSKTLLLGLDEEIITKHFNDCIDKLEEEKVNLFLNLAICQFGKVTKSFPDFHSAFAEAESYVNLHGGIIAISDKCLPASYDQYITTRKLYLNNPIYKNNVLMYNKLFIIPEEKLGTCVVRQNYTVLPHIEKEKGKVSMVCYHDSGYVFTEREKLVIYNW